MTPQQFRQQHSDFFYLDAEAPGEIAQYLESRAQLEPGETLQRCSRAGDGNMNCVVRVQTTQRTRILKQARPWVEKYPHIAAPWDRILREAKFLHLAARDPELAAGLPALEFLDPPNRLAIFEDLGTEPTLTGLYDLEPLGGDEAAALGTWLRRLHTLDVQGESFPNSDMRALNHEHIFEFPLRADNELDLEAITPGLEAAAREIQADAALCAEIRRLGREVYLADSGTSLLHGDFFPGSWLRSGGRIYIIDPEFGFIGRPEFDIGVALAHFTLARQPDSVMKGFISGYGADNDAELALQLAGIEMIRRLIGVAQLPLKADMPQKRAWLAQARQWILNPAAGA
ncbi:MAG: phosphotransferase [Opitutales bacterium]